MVSGKMGAPLKMMKVDSSLNTLAYRKMEVGGGRVIFIRVVAKCKPRKEKARGLEVDSRFMRNAGMAA